MGHFTTVKMVSCAAPDCKSRRKGPGPHKRFFTFPKDPVRKKQWAKALKRAGPDGYTLWQPTQYAWLCEVGHCNKTYNAIMLIIE